MAYEIKGKAISIGVNDSWQIAVDDVSSSTYDSSMGALGSSNRRAIIVPPGSYNQGVTMREYVDIYEEVPGGTINTGVIVNTVGSGYYISGDSPGDGYSSSGNTLTVSSVGGAGDRFATLQAAYDWLKSSDRDAEMGALSRTNKRVLYVPSPKYEASTSLILDTEYIDIVGNEGTTITSSVECDFVELTEGEVYTKIVDVTSSAVGTISVQASGIELVNLTVKNTYNASSLIDDLKGSTALTSIVPTKAGSDGVILGGTRFRIASDTSFEYKVGDAVFLGDRWFDIVATVVAGVDNYYLLDRAASVSGSDLDYIIASRSNKYINCNFKVYDVNYAKPISGIVLHNATLSQGLEGGEWINCTADVRGFRATYGCNFHPIMKNCECPYFGFGGDMSASFGDTDAAIMNGKYYDCIGDESCFAGCGAFSIDIKPDALFVNCTSGKNSFGIGCTVEGEFYNCHAGANSFAGYGGTGDTRVGVFSGKAVNCHAIGISFGSGDGAGCKNTGTLDNCTLGGMSESMNCEGSIIYNSRLEVTTTDIDAITLLDSNSKITHSEIKVVQGGTGVPINAGSALNVVVAHCTMNNATNDADGLGANITNLITTPYNVVDDNI